MVVRGRSGGEGRGREAVLKHSRRRFGTVTRGPRVGSLRPVNRAGPTRHHRRAAG
ncbi:MAG: hypothetical protein JNK72_12520 [Myxococcales bacterium]|nr:hypothetical protein [Myxococcales bacterium]